MKEHKMSETIVLFEVTVLEIIRQNPHASLRTMKIKEVKINLIHIIFTEKFYYVCPLNIFKTTLLDLGTRRSQT